MNKPLPLSKTAIAQSFSRYAKSYDEHAFIQKEIGRRLIERARTLNHAPKRILDLGSGPGTMFTPLRKAFPKAHIIGVDLAWGMIEKAKKGFWQSLAHKTTLVQGDMESLPFKPESFDLIFSNCAFQWGNDLPSLFEQIQSLLALDGGLFFSSFGPDTLMEFKKLWAQVDSNEHVLPFLDLHHYGDIMLKSGLTQPVVSQEHLTITYLELDKMLADLKYTGARNLSPLRAKGLTPPSKIKQLKAAFEKAKQPDGTFHSTFEVIYGHAIKPVRLFSGVKPVPLHLKK